MDEYQPKKQFQFVFEICRSETAVQKWHWRCKAANGEIRCHSENYVNKAGAVNACRSFLKRMKPGVARIDESWRDKIGPKFKRKPS